MKTSIDVILHKQRVLTNGEYPLVIRLTQNRKRKYIRIGISLNSQYWDSIKNKPKNNCPNKEYIKNIITTKLSEFQKQVLEFQSIGKEYSLNQLIDAVDKPLKNTTISEYLKTIIKNLIKENRVGNAKHYEALIQFIRDIY